MTLFADYFAEREGAQTIESDKSFCIYKLTADDVLFIKEFFVAPAARRTGEGRRLFDDVRARAKAANCKLLQGMIDLRAANANYVLLICLNAGFSMKQAQSNVILIEMEA